MTTIRGRLLQLLVPSLIAFITMISVFFYYNWYHEIINSYATYLKSVVTVTAKIVDPSDLPQLSRINNEDFNAKLYNLYQNKFEQIQENLPSLNLSIVKLESIKKGELLLPDLPKSPINKEIETNEKNTFYREKIILDFPQGKVTSVPESLYDIADPEELLAYKTKISFVTPVHVNPLNGERVMTAYAPIMNNENQVVALVAADANLHLIDRKLNQALTLIVCGAAFTMLLVILSVFLVANKISKPVQRLKNAALAIAAGDHSENVTVDGPQEIVELANTLNTMSECLDENLIRLKEASVAREKMYGEYECSFMLQNQMLQKVVDEFKNPHFSINHIKASSSSEIQGFLLDIQAQNNALNLIVTENQNRGFKNLYDLATEKYLPLEKRKHYVQILITDDNQSVSAYTQEMPLPFLWSTQEKNLFKITQNKLKVSSKDLVFIFNSSLLSCFENEVMLEKWLSKFLKHFSAEGHHFLLTMLTNEINFLAKKKHLEQEIHIICLQKNSENP